MSNLKKQAEELGIDVDGRWGDERLQQEIDKAKASKSKAKASAANTDVEPVSQADIAKANEDTLPTLGGPRVASSQEIREEAAGEEMEPAPFPGDRRRKGRRAAELSRKRGPAPEFNTSDIEKGEKGEKLYPIRLLNDWWDGQGLRHKRGEVIEVPYNEAKRLVGEMKAERADAFFQEG